MNVRALVIGFIGAFFLVFTVGTTVIEPGAGYFAGGHISGGHYNPAVTLRVLVLGKTDITSAVGYWIVQVLAAIVAAPVVTLM